MKKLMLVFLSLLFLLPVTSEAGNLSVLLNGKAIHLESAPAGTSYNEKNWGVGLQYDFDLWNDKWVPFVTASGFKDSNSNQSRYAGGGVTKRLMEFEDMDDLHIDGGVVAFLMTRKWYHDEKPFFGVLPFIEVGTEDISLNVTYIPKVDPKMVPLFFFQLKVNVLEF